MPIIKFKLKDSKYCWKVNKGKPCIFLQPEFGKVGRDKFFCYFGHKMYANKLKVEIDLDTGKDIYIPTAFMRPKSCIDKFGE